MSTVTKPAPVKQEKAVESVPEVSIACASAPSDAAPEDRPLRRDWLALMIWFGGAGILVLLHLVNFLEQLFRR